MKDEPSERPPLSERGFDYWFVTLPWILCVGALFVFVGMPFARMLVVCCLRGTDAYFRQGIRIPRSKHPLHFTDGGIVPELPYFLATFAVFIAMVGGLSLLLIYILRFYERRKTDAA